MRTIVDILKCGNLELFHSSMVAWLLDANGEHGMRAGVSAELADTLGQRGWPQLEKALAKGGGKVRTEVKRGSQRYDILLELPDTRVVLENKTKTVGNKPKLEAYGRDKTLVIALGLCEESFAHTVGEQYPVVTYRDVLSATKSAAEKGLVGGAFGTLVEQYISYLGRELGIIELVRNLILCPKEIDLQRLTREVRRSLYGENDKRFWNLIVLEQCRRILNSQSMWASTEWKLDKNMQSGVWLAGVPSDFTFDESIQRCTEDQGAWLWFHAELWGKALESAGSNTVVGMLQLRCEVENKRNKEFAEAFHTTYESKEGSTRARMPRSDAGSFYVVGKHLNGRDLLGEGIPQALTVFAQAFQ